MENEKKLPDIKVKDIKQFMELLIECIDEFSNKCGNHPTKDEWPEEFKARMTLTQASFDVLRQSIQQCEDEANELLRIAGDTSMDCVRQLREHIKNNPPGAGTVALLVVKIVVQERERALDEKKNLFAPVRAEGTKKKIKNSLQVRANVLKINSDLLQRPASEGWGSKKKRADYISKKTGNSFSYIAKIIATPRKINQS